MFDTDSTFNSNLDQNQNLTPFNDDAGYGLDSANLSSEQTTLTPSSDLTYNVDDSLSKSVSQDSSDNYAHNKQCDPLTGAEAITGTQGVDQFAIADPLDNSFKTIKDFEVGTDELKVFRLGAEFEDLTFKDNEEGTEIFDQGKSVALLEDVSSDELDADSFVFGDAKLADKLQQDLEQPIADGKITPGASVAVTAKDGTTWLGTAGVSDLENQTPMTTSDRSSIGSVTKPMVAATTLQLVEEGKLSLDDTLTEVLPKIGSQITNGDRITVRQLLSHTSGIPDFLSQIQNSLIEEDPAFIDRLSNDQSLPAELRDRLSELKNSSFEEISQDPTIQKYQTQLGEILDQEFVQSPLAQKQWTSEEFIATIYGQEANFEPGTEGNYSNTNYVLLGEIIEQVTDSTLASQLNERIFEPLGMNDSFYQPQEQISDGLTNAYQDLDGDEQLDNVALSKLDPSLIFGFSAGGIVSTPADVAKFAQGLFEGQLLDADTLDQMLTFNQDTPVFGEEPLTYGLGVINYSDDYKDLGELWGHGGNTYGWQTEMTYLPESGVTVVVMENGPIIVDPNVISQITNLEGTTNMESLTTKLIDDVTQAKS